MIELELKYGFLTNYKDTFFLKRGVMDGEETLYCSPPVKYYASLSRNAISVRQALLLLQTSTQSEKSSWYSKKISNKSIIRKRKNESLKETEGRVVTALGKFDRLDEARAEKGPVDKNPEMEGLTSGLVNLKVEGSQQGPITRARQARFANPPVSESPRSSRSPTPASRRPRK
jgi:hypothetical protein